MADIADDPICQTCPCAADDDACLPVERELWEARARISELKEALEFYADPENYGAIGFLIDPPCGEFASDFEPFDHRFLPCGEDHPHRRDRPGKRAREALTGGNEDE